MNIINSWTAKNKQNDKIQIKFRVSFLNVFEFRLDISKRQFKLVLFNFGIEV